MTSVRRHRRGRPPHPDVLTPAEWRVLDEIREGYSNPEIAERLGLSRNTVKTHVASMLGKLGLSDREQLAAWRETRQPVRGSRSFLAAPLGWLVSKGPAVALSAMGFLVGAGFLVAMDSGLIAGHGDTGTPREDAPAAVSEAAVSERTASPASTSAVEPGAASIEVTALADAEVEILAGGISVFSGPIRAGERVSGQGSPFVEIWADNARDVEITVNGHHLGVFADAVGQPAWNRIRWRWPADWSPTPAPAAVPTGTPPASVWTDDRDVRLPPGEMRWLDKDGFVAAMPFDDRDLTPEEKAADPLNDPRWPDLARCLERAGWAGLPAPGDFVQADLDLIVATVNRGGPFLMFEDDGPRYLGTPESDRFIGCAQEILS